MGGSYYIRRGNTFMQTDSSNVNITDKLPAGTYALKFSVDTGFYFEIVDNFTVPEVLYGDINTQAKRILTTFKSRDVATGVLLSGEKGSGKTLLAKIISRDLIQEGAPTILINTEFVGEEFNTFIQELDQPALILFDEFEKIYKDESQEKVLTLFDGVYPTKKLFMVTSNSSYKLNDLLKNRPGRLYYCFEYNGLEANFVQDYAAKNLNDKTQVDSVVRLTCMFDKFNFDMLKAIVEEMNRYGETAQQVLKVINAKPSAERAITYLVESIVYRGITVPLCFAEREVQIAPLNHGGAITLYTDGYEPDDDTAIASLPENQRKTVIDMIKEFGLEEDSLKDKVWWLDVQLEPNFIAEINGVTGSYTYRNEELKMEVRIKRKPVETKDYSSWL